MLTLDLHTETHRGSLSSSGAWRKHSFVISTTVFLVILSCFPEISLGGLSLSKTKPCGDDGTCKEYEYCSPFHHTCAPCSRVCDEGNNNFNKDTCEADCQDYLHDQRCLKVQNGCSDVSSSSLESLQRDVTVLKILIAICLVVLGLVISAFIAFMVYFWRSISVACDESKSKDLVKSPPTPFVDEKGTDKNLANGKPCDLPIIYNNKYHSRHDSPHSRRRKPETKITSRPNDSNNGEPHAATGTNENEAESPSKLSTTETLNSINSAGNTSRATISTTLNSSDGSHNTNGLSNKYRREPSESTIPHLAYDCASLSPAQGPIYTHHV